MLLAATPLSAAAASFDCAKAKSRIETLICSTPALSALDDQLAQTYRAALSRASDRAAVVHWQREWLRSDALAPCTNAACVTEAYQQRIAVLGQVAPDDAQARWTGNYIRVRNGKDDNTAQLTVVHLGAGKLHVLGAARWEGSAAGQVNTGEINGTARQAGPRASFDQDGCEAQLVLKASRLQVESESGCGGLNVTFVGEYRRK